MTWMKKEEKMNRETAEKALALAAMGSAAANSGPWIDHRSELEKELDALGVDMRQLEADINRALELEASAEASLAAARLRREHLQKIADIKATAIRSLEAELPAKQEWIEAEGKIAEAAEQMEKEIVDGTGAQAGLAGTEA